MEDSFHFKQFDQMCESHEYLSESNHLLSKSFRKLVSHIDNHYRNQDLQLLDNHRSHLRQMAEMMSSYAALQKDIAENYLKGYTGNTKKKRK